ncbi:sodium:solute symporter family protein [Natrinema salifodinae]|uniref:Na+/proline symporter n=1 Tax=Natrinema salifodinae TaxID=1202768 RepID=A0A1I0NN68_9EURY|nr:Na+:solute symporter [Natrinema salifodinae]SEW02781.1 Na+/proline symporter [Natrinema salifodinae]
MSSPGIGYALLGLWALGMIGLSYLIFRRQDVDDTREFITAGGRAQVGLTTASFAVTWMWAGDILGVPEYVGLTGVAGIWMYAAPAVLSSLVVIPFALRMRRLFPQGLTYSEYFIERFGKRAHLAVIAVILYTMVLGGVIQLYVGGTVIGGLTGIDPNVVMAVLMGTIGIYILLGGLWGSMTTDLVQFVSAIVLTVVFVPLLLFEAGGPSGVYEGLLENLGSDAAPFLTASNLDWIEDLFLPYALGLGVWGVVSLSTWQRIFAVRRDKTSRFLTAGGIGVFTTIAMYGVIGLVGLAAVPEVGPADLSIEALGLLPGWATVLFLVIALMVLGSSVDSYLTAIASLTSRDIYFRHVATDAADAQQLRVARLASVAFAAVIFGATVVALDTLGFTQLLLIGGIGATALVGPFALSLFWSKTSSLGFVTGVVGSQLVTGYLLAASYDVVVTAPTLKLWEIMAVGHLVATALTATLSAASPDDFEFDSIAREPTAGAGPADAAVRPDGGATGADGGDRE